MLCKKASERDLERSWIAQRKYDGVRCIAYCDNTGVKLLGRSGKDYTKKFPEIVEQLKGFNCIFDGEICCETFQQTQSRTLTQDKQKLVELRFKYPAKYFIFDILKEGNTNLMNKPLIERLLLLDNKFWFNNEIIDIVYHSWETKIMWDRAINEKWEGIILKNPQSHYVSGRSGEWLKLKCVKSKDLEFYHYTINPAGVRAETKDRNIAVQVAGHNSKKFLEQYNQKGYCVVEVEYLEEFSNGKLRMPICKEVKE